MTSQGTLLLFEKPSYLEETCRSLAAQYWSVDTVCCFQKQLYCWSTHRYSLLWLHFTWAGQWLISVLAWKKGRRGFCIKCPQAFCKCESVIESFQFHRHQSSSRCLLAALWMPVLTLSLGSLNSLLAVSCWCKAPLYLGPCQEHLVFLLRDDLSGLMDAKFAWLAVLWLVLN